MKGLILAAGLGTRLRPLTRPPAEGGRSKPLVPLANQPLIAYALQKLTQAGIGEIGIVVGENEAEMRTALRHSPLSLRYIRQSEPKGLAHAVACAQGFTGADDFVLLFCDNLFAEPLSLAVSKWRELRSSLSDVAALVHTYEMPDPRACGVAVVEDGYVVEMEEKPAQPKSNLAVIGIDFLTPAIYDAIGRIKPSKRGELEITDAIAELIVLGGRVAARPLSGFWFDTGKFSDLITAHPPVLEAFGAFQVRGKCGGCELKGQVGLARDSVVNNSTLAGPVLVGAHAIVRDCILGPHVSVGERCELAGCTLRNCQVYPGTRLDGVQAEDMLFDGQYRFTREGQANGG